MHLKELQQQFKDTILKNTAHRIPIKENTFTKEEHFYIYYNTFFNGLSEVLNNRYKHTSQLIERKLFKDLVGHYIHQYLPKTPYLCHYGNNFPNFIQPYVHASIYELCILESFLQDALLSPPTPAPSVKDLANLAPDTIPSLRLSLCESIRFLEAHYDLKELWLGKKAFLPKHKNQFYLIYAKNMTAFFEEISVAEYAFIQSLHARRNLQESFATALKKEKKFCLQSALQRFLAIGLLKP